MVFLTCGIMVIMRDPVFSNLYVLLGKENNVHGWYWGSNKWCAFHGRQEEGEKIVETAARECTEESFGMLPCTQHELTERLKNGDYVFKVTKEYKKRGAVCGTSILYVIELPFCADIPFYFQHWRSKLQPLYTQIKLSKELVKRMKNMKGYSTHMDPYFSKSLILIHFKVEPFNSVEYLDQYSVEYTYKNKQGELLTINTGPVGVELRDACELVWVMFQEVCRMYNVLETPYKDHACFDIKWNNQNVVYVNIKDEYWEKQSIAFWSLDRLKHVITCNGVFQREYFRKSFLPLLKKCVDFLA